MKTHILFIVSLFTLLLTSCILAYGEDQTEYTIQIGGNCSATWIIRRTVGVQDSIDTLEEFQNRVEALVETAKNKT
jgi:hypothetical protein